MFAVISFGGRQFKIKEDCYFTVNSFQGDVGEQVLISDVIMFCKSGKLITGDELKDLKVTCEVTEHGKTDKIIVFKSKQRQKARTKNGYRNDYSILKVLSIASS